MNASATPYGIILIVGLSSLVHLGRPSFGAEPFVDALRATVRITKGDRSGTGFLVAVGEKADSETRIALVTAAHVLESIEGESCTVVFRGRDKNGVVSRKEMETPIRKGAKPLWERHPELDVAVIAIHLPDGADVKPFEFARIADAKWTEDGRIQVGREVCIPCYPAKVEANAAGWPVLRRGSLATHPLTPASNAKTMFVDYSHFGGDSGSPVVAWAGNELVVVGLVFALLRQSDSTRSPFEERTVHTPLGLANAVQSPFVRQTIEEWRRRRP